LHRLTNLQLLIYEPASDDPQIIFLMPRQDAEHLPISKKIFESRRQLHFDKMDAMINYVEQKHQCRMQLIQGYFDEITYETCGVCDVCISKKKKNDDTTLHDYLDQINYLLSKNPMNIDELETAVAPKDKELFIESVRLLIDQGVIFYNDVWILHKK